MLSKETMKEIKGMIKGSESVEDLKTLKAQLEKLADMADDKIIDIEPEPEDEE